MRTSLALSLCIGKSFKIVNIRAARKKPGLRRQHFVCVNAAAEIGNASIKGAELSSQELTFVPKTIKSGKYHFEIGTAGSITLVLQSVLPALLIADGPSKSILEGGTHNPLAPSFDFLERALIAIINRMGPHIEASLERTGYYPRGGGKISVVIEVSRKLKSLDINERGKIRAKRTR